MPAVVTPSGTFWGEACCICSETRRVGEQWRAVEKPAPTSAPVSQVQMARHIVVIPPRNEMCSDAHRTGRSGRAAWILDARELVARKIYGIGWEKLPNTDRVHVMQHVHAVWPSVERAIARAQEAEVTP